MVRKGMTVKEAAQEWVREFNAIDQDIISELMRNNIDDWTEVTMPSKYDRVYVYNRDDCNNGEICNVDDGVYEIELNNGEFIKCEENEFEVERYDLLPMWGTMWSFGDSCDEYWLTNENGIEEMSKLGFRIFESYNHGYYFGIDGAGYDFYEAHWIPLYMARGLHWHDENVE